MKTILPLLALTAVAAAPSPAAAQPATTTAPPQPAARWSLAMGGGALIPVRAMRGGFQDALVAGMRVGVRSRIGLGAVVAIDYSPLPRRADAGETFDTTYGTALLMPAWTIGRGWLRVQIAGGGGVAVERSTDGSDGATQTVAQPAAAGQLGLELHVTDGGGLVLLGGGTRTFGDEPYEYGWAMGGLLLEF